MANQLAKGQRIPTFRAWSTSKEALQAFPKVPAVVVSEIIHQNGIDVNAVRQRKLRQVYEQKFGIAVPEPKPKRRIKVAEPSVSE